MGNSLLRGMPLLTGRLTGDPRNNRSCSSRQSQSCGGAFLPDCGATDHREEDDEAEAIAEADAVVRAAEPLAEGDYAREEATEQRTAKR